MHSFLIVVNVSDSKKINNIEIINNKRLIFKIKFFYTKQRNGQRKKQEKQV